VSRLEEAAIRLHEIIWTKTGDNADWPISFLCDDMALDEFLAALNELGNAVEEVKPGSKVWPLWN
jgi:hypothetical protein